MGTTCTVGMTIYCIINGEVRRRQIRSFSTNGTELIVVTDRGEDLVYMLDAFPTKREANSEMHIRLRGC